MIFRCIGDFSKMECITSRYHQISTHIKYYPLPGLILQYMHSLAAVDLSMPAFPETIISGKWAGHQIHQRSSLSCPAPLGFYHTRHYLLQGDKLCLKCSLSWLSGPIHDHKLWKTSKCLSVIWFLIELKTASQANIFILWMNGLIRSETLQKSPASPEYLSEWYELNECMN